MINAFISGFLLGLSLILPIGAQNAFVLRQGIKKEFIFLVCLICAFSDALMIWAGILGFGVAIQKIQYIETFARYFAFIFLFIYSLKSFYSSFRLSHSMQTSQNLGSSRLKTVLLVLAFTWLNPHVYLDTVILLGSVSTSFGSLAWMFGLGAMSASFLFFFSLGYGARVLIPLFNKPISWKILEFITGVIMMILAFTFLFS